MTMFTKFRFWLIRKIAGRLIVGHNLTVRDGGIDLRAASRPALLSECHIEGDKPGLFL